MANNILRCEAGTSPKSQLRDYVIKKNSTLKDLGVQNGLVENYRQELKDRKNEMKEIMNDKIFLL